MITDENAPEMVVAHQELLRRLGSVLGSGYGRVDKSLMQKMFDIVKTHKEQSRTKGIDFPALVAVVVPRLGIVEWSRADLDISSIRIKIVNFVRDHPTVSMVEMVAAFRAAWPSIKPDDIAAPADSLAKGLMKKAQNPT